MVKEYNCSFASFSRKSMFMALCAVMIGAFAGCSTPQVKPEPVFFPPPPNPPRVQFLKSISSSKDVEKEKSRLWVSGFTAADMPKPIVKPYGIAYNKDKLYVCDVQGNTVVIIDLFSETFDYLKGNLNYGKLKKPVNIAVDDAGNMYVVDTARKEVLMYDAAGSFIKTYGKEIAKKPVDVAIHDTNLFILDLGDNDIKVIDMESGDLVRSIGKSEEGKSLSMPTNFTIDNNGLIYITNVGSGNVIKLDVDGHFLGSFGKLGDAFGEFTRPKGIAVDGQNRMFVVDGGAQNVQLFAENQRLMMFFGNPPLKTGALNLPTGIALTTDHLDYFQKLAEPDFVVEQVIFVANQMGNSKISIYGLGHKKEAEPAKPKKK